MLPYEEEDRKRRKRRGQRPDGGDEDYGFGGGGGSQPPGYPPPPTRGGGGDENKDQPYEGESLIRGGYGDPEEGGGGVQPPGYPPPPPPPGGPGTKASGIGLDGESDEDDDGSESEENYGFSDEGDEGEEEQIGTEEIIKEEEEDIDEDEDEGRAKKEEDENGDDDDGDNGIGDDGEEDKNGNGDGNGEKEKAIDIDLQERAEYDPGQPRDVDTSAADEYYGFLRDKARGAMDDPSRYSADVVQQGSKVIEDAIERMRGRGTRAIGEHYASRGLTGSMGAGMEAEGMRDFEMELQRLQQERLFDLQREQAMTYGQDRASAFGQGLGAGGLTEAGLGRETESAYRDWYGGEELGIRKGGVESMERLNQMQILFQYAKEFPEIMDSLGPDFWERMLSGAGMTGDAGTQETSEQRTDDYGFNTQTSAGPGNEYAYAGGGQAGERRGQPGAWVESGDTTFTDEPGRRFYGFEGPGGYDTSRAAGEALERGEYDKAGQMWDQMPDELRRILGQMAQSGNYYENPETASWFGERGISGPEDESIEARKRYYKQFRG
jgi:hypothetical protein